MSGVARNANCSRGDQTGSSVSTLTVVFWSWSPKSKNSISDESGAKVTRCTEQKSVFWAQTVQDNVMFPLKMFKKQSEEQMLERVNFVLKRVNLENSNSKFPAELSGGMQKRVAIARAIVMNPKYLFCDEPNSGLDPNTAILIDNLIQEITDEYKITTVINTHDMNSVMQIGDKIVFLKDGVKAWEGTNKEIFKTDNEAVVKFVYSSELFKKVRLTYLNETK